MAEEAIHVDDSGFAPSQWETALLFNDVSHWLGASLESVLHVIAEIYEGQDQRI